MSLRSVTQQVEPARAEPDAGEPEGDADGVLLLRPAARLVSALGAASPGHQVGRTAQYGV